MVTVYKLRPSSAAQVQQELPRLDQALETLAAHLKERADLSADAKAAALARVEQARAVLRSHGETLQRAAAYFGTATDWTNAGQDIDALAELLNVEGDKVVSVVAEETARQGGNADQLAAAHAAYRKAMAELVDAARRAREAARIAREQGQVAGESRGGKGDKR
jgi:ABC-type transporter Mla subunit MlaD